MRFFDAHCDAVMHAYRGEHPFVEGAPGAHLDLPRLLDARFCAQVFAIFATRRYYPDRDLRALAEEAAVTIHRWAAASEGRMRVAVTAADLGPACVSGAGVAAIIGLEGADPLEGRADHLQRFFDLGVRLVIPAWDDNEFAGGATGSGGPLTPEGIKLVELAEALGVMVDVSHLSDMAFDQVRLITRRPFIASHSNCRSLSPSPRNLTDAQIRALSDRGGVMGINLAPDFLDPGYLAAWDAIMEPVRLADPATRRKHRKHVDAQLRAIQRPCVDWIARHASHAIAVGGEGCVGLGGDLDGISFMPDGVTGAESYPLIASALAAAGLTARQVDRVCWQNMARVFEAVLPAA